MNPESTGFQTAKEAYDWCMSTGVISTRVSEVFKALTDSFGIPLNCREVHHNIQKATDNYVIDIRSVSPRFAVLERMGLIKESDKKPCPVTGRLTVFYEVTLARPTCTEAEAMKASSKKETFAGLTRENKELREENTRLREYIQSRSAGHAEVAKRIAAAPKETQQKIILT